jgi:hypothetical protein
VGGAATLRQENFCSDRPPMIFDSADYYFIDFETDLPNLVRERNTRA